MALLRHFARGTISLISSWHAGIKKEGKPLFRNSRRNIQRQKKDFTS